MRNKRLLYCLGGRLRERTWIQREEVTYYESRLLRKSEQNLGKKIDRWVDCGFLDSQTYFDIETQSILMQEEFHTGVKRRIFFNQMKRFRDWGAGGGTHVRGARKVESPRAQ